MQLIHKNKEYKLLLVTNKYRYYIYQDELVLVDVKNGYVNDSTYIAEYFLEDSFENIAKGTEREIYMDEYEKQARKELGEPYGKSI